MPRKQKRSLNTDESKSPKKKRQSNSNAGRKKTASDVDCDVDKILGKFLIKILINSLKSWFHLRFARNQSHSDAILRLMGR